MFFFKGKGIGEDKLISFPFLHFQQRWHLLWRRDCAFRTITIVSSCLSIEKIMRILYNYTLRPKKIKEPAVYVCKLAQKSKKEK